MRTVRTKALCGRLEENLQIVQFRDIVESAATKFAATSVTNDPPERMDETTTLADSHHADKHFHLATAKGSGNELLIRAIDDTHVRMFEPVDALAL